MKFFFAALCIFYLNSNCFSQLTPPVEFIVNKKLSEESFDSIVRPYMDSVYGNMESASNKHYVFIAKPVRNEFCSCITVSYVLNNTDLERYIGFKFFKKYENKVMILVNSEVSYKYYANLLGFKSAKEGDKKSIKDKVFKISGFNGFTYEPTFLTICPSGNKSKVTFYQSEFDVPKELSFDNQ